MLFLNRSSQASTPQASSGVAGFWRGIWDGPSSPWADPASATTARRCNNPECMSARISPWRNRRRPIFEAQWGCSGRCVLAMVRHAIRREAGSGLTVAAPRHSHRLPLGLLMLSEGWISHEQLQTALALQREQGGRIGDCMVQACGVERELVTRGLSLQWSCPVLTSRSFEPSAMSLVAPHPLMEEFGFLPLRAAGNRLLYLGFEQSLDASVALALQHMTGLTCESGLVETAEYQQSRNALLQQPSIPSTVETVSDPESLAGRITALLEQRQPKASRLVRVHHYLWLRLWLEGSAGIPQAASPQNLEEMQDYLFYFKK